MNFVFCREAQETVKKVTRWQRLRMEVFGSKVCIGHEKRDGWNGELPFYLFLCKACKRFAKDYPHGHIERQYLNCSFCDAHHDFVPLLVQWKILFETLRIAWKYREIGRQ